MGIKLEVIMDSLLREYCVSDLNSIFQIWNNIIKEEECFLWEKEFPIERILEILDEQEAVICSVNRKTNEVNGFYIIHKNHDGRGAHVANALYAVKKENRGMGIGKSLALHSIKKATALGYEAIQFNSVVSENKASIHLWESLGFVRVGMIPNGYKNKMCKYYDLYIYYKEIKLEKKR